MTQGNSKLLIIGNGAELDLARTIAEEYAFSDIKLIQINSEDFFRFDYSVLEPYLTPDWKVHVASNSYAVNYARIQLIVNIVSQGFKLTSLISGKASIGSNVTIKPGTLICPSAVVMGDVSIGIGAIISPGCIIGIGAKLEKFVFLHSQAVIGEYSNIKYGATIGANILLKSYSTIGLHCEINIQSDRLKFGVDRFFIDEKFPRGMQVFGF
jgi:hypothetical protein